MDANRSAARLRRSSEVHAAITAVHEPHLEGSFRPHELRFLCAVGCFARLDPSFLDSEVPFIRTGRPFRAPEVSFRRPVPSFLLPEVSFTYSEVCFIYSERSFTRRNAPPK